MAVTIAEWLDSIWQWYIDKISTDNIPIVIIIYTTLSQLTSCFSYRSRVSQCSTINKIILVKLLNQFKKQDIIMLSDAVAIAFASGIDMVYRKRPARPYD